MADNDGQAEASSADDDDRVVVAARVPKEKKEQIENELSYGDHLQDWLEDAIDRKLAASD